jgi:tetratricopeptide (TPR) repeat protein
MSDANADALQKRSIFQNALAMHQRGQLGEAERLYRELLKLNADDFDAVHLLGVIFVQRGQFIEGERLIAQALEIDPNEPNAQNNQGIALAELNRFDESVASFDKAIAHKPDYAEAFVAVEATHLRRSSATTRRLRATTKRFPSSRTMPKPSAIEATHFGNLSALTKPW